MKLINKDITYVIGQEEFDELLDHVYFNEREYQPSKQNMRVRWNRKKSPTVSWWDDRPGRCGRDNWKTIRSKLRGHIHKWMGRKFDDCFSDLKRKVLTDKDWQLSAFGFGSSKDKKYIWYAWRNEFLSEFDSGSRWSKPSYRINQDGLIEKNPEATPRRVKNRNLIIHKPISERKPRYIVRHDNVSRLRDIIVQYWGWNKYIALMNSNEFSLEQYYRQFYPLLASYSNLLKDMYEAAITIRYIRDQVLKYGRYSFYYASTSDKVKRILFNEVLEPNEEYIYGTKEYFIKRAEIKKRDRAADKARKHPDRTLFDFTLWYSKHLEAREVTWRECVKYGSYDAAIKAKENDKTRSKSKDT